MLYRQYAQDAPDPALATRWYIMVPDSQGPTFCVAESASLTFRKIPAKGRFRAGKNANFSDNSEIDALNIVFYETHDYRVTKWLEAWRKQIYDSKTGSYGVKKKYAKDIKAMLLGLDTNEPKLTLTYKECFPTDQSAWQVAYEDAAGRLKVEAQFATDDVEYN